MSYMVVNVLSFLLSAKSFCLCKDCWALQAECLRKASQKCYSSSKKKEYRKTYILRILVGIAWDFVPMK